MLKAVIMPWMKPLPKTSSSRSSVLISFKIPQDGSYLDYLSFEATFVFSTFLYYVVILVKNTGVFMLLSGVIKDRVG